MAKYSVRLRHRIMQWHEVVYREGNRWLTATVEFARTIILYGDSLSNWHEDGKETALTEAERPIILDRILKRLRFQALFCKVVVETGIDLSGQIPVTSKWAQPPYLLLNPHGVKHPEGFTVEYTGPTTVRYRDSEESERWATVFVRSGDTDLEIHSKTLSGWISEQGVTELSPQERDLVLQRIQNGLEALAGIPYRLL